MRIGIHRLLCLMLEKLINAGILWVKKIIYMKIYRACQLAAHQGPDRTVDEVPRGGRSITGTVIVIQVQE